MSAPKIKLRRKKQSRGTERGIALVMVMGAIAILTVMLAEFQDETSAELAAATAQRDGLQAEYAARSGMNLSRLLIASEPTMRKAIAPLFMLMKRNPPQLPLWSFSDRILGIFNDPESSAGSAASLGINVLQGKNLGLPAGAWELQIVDEDSKINFNLGAANEVAHIRLAKEIMGLVAPIQYDTIFSSRDGQGQISDRFATCAAIIDWADVDENMFNCNTQQTTAASNTGIEDNNYALMKPKPYRRKNAPYDSLEELHMVRGVSEDFWATFIDPAPEDPKKRVVTVWGQGAVNVNTANAQTLYAITCAGASTTTPQPLCTDPLQAQTFMMAVTMMRGITMGAPVFGSVKDFTSALSGQGQMGPLLTGLGLKPVQFQSVSDFQKSITTESKMFSIYAVGIKKGYRRETRVKLHSVIDFRNAPDLTQPVNPNATSGTGGGTSTTGATTSATTAAQNAQNAQNALAQANGPATGGQIIYFKVD